MKLPVISPILRLILSILSIVLFAVTALSAYGGRVNPYISGIPGILVMGMPFMVVLSGIVILCWLLARRWITAGIGLACLLAAWGPISSAVPLKSSRNPRAGKDSFSIMTWNFLHGFDQHTTPGKQQGNKALDFILETDADIVCLQEISFWTPDEIPNLNEGFNLKFLKKYPYMAFQANNDNRIFSKYPVKCIPSEEMARRINYVSTESMESYANPMRHFTFYEIDILGRKLMIVNCHLFSPGLSEEEREVVTDITGVSSAKESAREFKNTIFSKITKGMQFHKTDIELITRALTNYKYPVIICGDFNDVTESYAWNILKKAGYKDAYAEVGFGPLITYNKHRFWLHLDHIFYRGGLRPLNLKKHTIDTSDHYPLSATFEFD